MWGQVDALPKIAPCLATLQKKKAPPGQRHVLAV